jgi:hypothetical protein
MQHALSPWGDVLAGIAFPPSALGFSLLQLADNRPSAAAAAKRDFAGFMRFV